MAHRQVLHHDPAIGPRFVPGIRARVEHEGGGYLIRVNDAGFRSDHEFVAARTPGRFRALMFGDSVTAGQGVSNGQRFSDLLEQSIPDLEIYNYGINGAGTDQQYLVFKQAVTEIEHDLVILPIWLENIRRNVAGYRLWVRDRGLGSEPLIVPKPYFTLASDDSLELHHVPVPKPIPLSEFPESERDQVDWARARRQRWRHVASRLKLGPLVSRLPAMQPLPEYDQANGAAWRLQRAILRQWITDARTPLLLCLIPTPDYVDRGASAKGYRARFAELSDPPNVVVHDLLPDLVAHPAEERRLFRFPIDIHPTPRGHEAIARSLSPAILDALPAARAQGVSAP